MPRRVVVTGATGNQGGSVARLLLKHPDKYTVRVVTRNPDSPAAQSLAQLGAEVVKADLVDYDSLIPAFKDCWGAFVVTNFYDDAIKGDVKSEEQQGRHAAKAALETGIQCYVWSTLPSSVEISKGEVCCEIYEGKHRVDAYIRDLGLPASFVYTGNFYENMVLRKHVVLAEDGQKIQFRQPVIEIDSKIHMCWVERDLAAVTMAVLDHWDGRKDELRHRYLYAMDAVRTPKEICAAIQKVSGKPVEYVCLKTTGNEQRDIMFKLYNKTGTYPGVKLPDQNVLDLGVELHGVEQFIEERLVPHLGLK